MKYKDYYAALGVPPDADLDQIKKAYRKLARQHHPDVSKAAGAEARFKDVAEAYATLKDPEKRAAYDELGRRPAGEEFAPPPQWRHQYGAETQGFEDIDLADILAAMGRSHPQAHRGVTPMPGRDFETEVRIGLEDAYRGASLDLHVDDGAGGRTLVVTIPPGVIDGQKLRLRGKGGRGRHGGPAGDIYLHITLAPHKLFRVDHHDLFFDLALTPWEAALGAEVEVPTLDGPVVLTVPPLTGTGRKLRLRGRGLAKAHGGRGDLYAIARIEIPRTLTEQERKLFQELAGASHFNPRAGASKESENETSAT
jgi:curved DNA-binding protein